MPYDATTKALIEIAPADWLDLMGWRGRKRVELVDADLSTITKMADRVLRLPGRRPSLVHMEFQSSRDPHLVYRLLGYNALLIERHRLPVRSVVVLLRPEADGRELNGRLTMPGSIDFEYRVIRPWELPLERILACGVGVLPLAPLSNLHRADPSDVVRRMDRRFRAEAAPGQLERLWAASWVLMGLKYPAALVDELLKGVGAMKESSTWQAAVQEGVQLGQVEEARGLVLRLGGKWLGEPDRATSDFLRELDDREKLETIAERLRDARTWADALRGS